MKKKFDIFALLFIIIVSIAITSKEFQNDTFYIIKVGESIFKNGIDMIDHFSIHNIMYPYEHWLHDVMVYIIYAKTGFTGLYISNIIFASVLGLLMYFLTKKLYKNEYISLFLTIIVLFLMKNFIATRAQLISYIIFVAEIYFIEMLNKSGKNKYIIFLCIGSILCSNIHSAVWPMYLVLFLPYLASFVLTKYYKSEFNIKKLKIYKKKNNLFFNCDSNKYSQYFETNSNELVKKFFIAFLLCIISGLINLNHNQCFIHFIYLKLGGTLNSIGEHLPIVLYNNFDFLIYLIFLIIIFCKNKKNVNIKNILLLGGLLFLTISSYRHMALFLTIGIYPVTEILSTFKFKSNLQMKKILLFVSVFVLVFSVLLFNNSFNKKYVSDSYPIDAAKYINKNIDKKKMNLFNDYDYGSYLIFKDIKVFIDSRAALYTKQFNKLKYDIYDDWNEVFETGRYKKIFKRYNITHIITEKNSILYYALKSDPNYHKIYSDKNYTIYEYKKRVEDR